MRHKWTGKPIGNSGNYNAGLAVACVRCGCVKEIISGRVAYFQNDTVYHTAPECGHLQGSQPWPLLDVLKKLVEASEILLREKDYDGDGWEQIHYAAESAKKIINQLTK